MTLGTMQPDGSWDPGNHPEVVETLSDLDESYVFLVWGDDGCPDCQERLPAFGAAVEAAGIPDGRVIQYEVERLPQGEKRGPKVEAYGVSRIPTVVVEREGEEVARFVEEEDRPIPEYLADRLREIEASA